jgi:RNA polymerase sigma factor (sigma-70 family)
VTDSDETLALRARGGDREAFDSLVHRHKGALYGYCRRYVGDADDAVDILQDAFVAAWMGLSRYDARRPFAAWLRAITLNKCRDFGRRRSVRRLFLARFEREQAPLTARLQADTPPDPQDERLDRLEREIAALAPAYKEALLLTTFGGLSQQQAACELGISVKAIGMRIYRAKRELAGRMKE